MATLKGKWVFNDILVNNTSNNDREDIRQNIYFSSNNRNFESVYIEFGNYENGLASLSYRLYNGTGYNVMYVEGYGWNYFGQADRTPYKIIDFGETEQTVNDDFYAWFKANSIELKVTDLTNTTWYVPSGWQAEHAYGTFAINYSVSYDSVSLEGSELIIGFDSGVGDDGTNHIAFENNMYFIYNGIAFTISITGGTDVTNHKLIAWLSKYGELQEKGETTDTKPVYLRKNGAWVKQDAYERQNGEWVQVSYAD